MKTPLSWLAAVVAALALAPAKPLAKAEKQPNIFFLSDDHRWDRLGSAGHPFLKTPTLDRLAKEGVRFSNMFVTTSIYAASRATILTGLYERTRSSPFAPADRQPVQPGELSGAAAQGRLQDRLHRQVRRQRAATRIGRRCSTLSSRSAERLFQKQPDGSLRHESELAGDRAIEFIDQHKGSGPFCLSVSFNAAHAEDGDKRPGIGHFPWPKAVDGFMRMSRSRRRAYPTPRFLRAIRSS